MTESVENGRSAVSGASGRPQRSGGRRVRRARARLLPPPAWWPLPACAALGLAAGLGYGLLKAPEYVATSYVVAVPGKNAQPATALGFAQAYARIATGPATLNYAAPRAGVSARQLHTRVRAETSPESPMIAITGTAGRPQGAADIANAVSDALTLTSNQSAANTGVQLLMFSQAVAPTEAASPSAPISGAVGLCAGGLSGALALLARPRRGRRSGPPLAATTITTVPAQDSGEASASQSSVKSATGQGVVGAGAKEPVR
ncbi:lipopolysaccharide biosynthesis protein [Streptomyces sp. NPDC006879]|uniref:lipopolysaccharide biosynthesis protein n=1 Tax=Streptomyces sp. NPDC006879 TaxID=3364767 RepID=UPI0036B8EA70